MGFGTKAVFIAGLSSEDTFEVVLVTLELIVDFRWLTVDGGVLPLRSKLLLASFPIVLA